MVPRPGMMAKMPPPIPLLAGRPTRYAISPAAPYIPDIKSTALTRRTDSAFKGAALLPRRARKSPLRAMSFAEAAIAHCEKYWGSRLTMSFQTSMFRKHVSNCGISVVCDGF